MQLSSHLSHLIVHQTFSRWNPHRQYLHLCVADMYLLWVLTLTDCGPVDRIEILQLLYLWDCIEEEWVSVIDCVMHRLLIWSEFHSTSTGVISITQLSLNSSSFLAANPSFTLLASTSGGPPETYTWTRDGVEISNSDSYTISFGLTPNERTLVDSLYNSRLIVRGRLPGVYRYSVTNRDTPTNINQEITIEGIKLHFYVTADFPNFRWRCSNWPAGCADWTW